MTRATVTAASMFVPMPGGMATVTRVDDVHVVATEELPMKTSGSAAEMLSNPVPSMTSVPPVIFTKDGVHDVIVGAAVSNDNAAAVIGGDEAVRAAANH